jgi:general secretion pathway protein D
MKQPKEPQMISQNKTAPSGRNVRRIPSLALAAAVVVAQLVADMPAVGQESAPTTAPSVAPAPPVNPPATQPQVQSTRPNREPQGVRTSNGRLTLNFQDAPIDTVLDELSTTAGFIVVKQVRPEGRVTLVSKQPVTAEEAIPLLNTVLRNAGTGYAAIQQDRVLKIVDLNAAKTLNIPVYSGADPDKIADNDTLITQVIPLKYSDSTQLKTDLQPLISPDAQFTSNASSNVLIITDTSANIKRVVRIVASLDTSVADQVDVRVFKLNFAESTSAAKLVNDVFGNLSDARTQGSNAQAQPQPGGGGFGGGGFGRFFGGGGQQGNNNRRNSGKVTASSDTRTNSVVVSGPADTLKIVDTVIKQLDANPAIDQNVYVYRLRNAQALNIEQVMNALFNGTTISNRSTQSNADRLTASRSTSGSSFSTGNSTGRTTTGGTSNTRVTSGGGNAQRLSQQSQQAANDLSGQVSIIADTDSNSLLLRTAPANFPRLKSVLDELDKPVQQVLIKVLFAEVTHNNTTDIGAELSILNLRDNRIAPNDTTATGAAGGRTLGPIGASNFGLPAAGTAGSGLVIQLLEQNFQATIRLLEQTGKLDVLSRPYILASDNQLASIVVGQSIPFITDSRVTDAGQQINTTEYRDIGILLDVIPHVNPDGVVILDVAPEISTLTGETIQTGPNVSQPIIAKRSAQSRVGVKTGQTIVIGGLMQDNLTETVNKVPLLGDIPWLGELFKQTRRVKQKTELLIFLTPHVAASPDVLDGMTKQEEGGLKLIPGAVGPGVYKEHREGLDRGEPPVQEFKSDPFVVPQLGNGATTQPTN